MVRLPGWNKLPAVTESGSLLPYLSPKDREKKIAYIYEATGGDAETIRLIEADDNRNWDFRKHALMDNRIKPEVVVNASESIEDLIRQLDDVQRAERATVIEAVASEVTDAVEEEPK